MFNPAINPANPNNVFVSCDMTGSFVTYDAGDRWRMFNLRGVVRFYAFDPTDPNIVYAGTSNMLFKSDDQGRSWNVIYPTPSSIVSIVSQGDHASERVVTRDSLVQTVVKMIIDPDNSKKLVLLVNSPKGETSDNKGGRNEPEYSKLLISKDGGNLWEDYIILSDRYDNVFLDPTSSPDDRTIFISSNEKLRSRKDGVWSDVDLPEKAGKITQYASGVDTESNRFFIYALSGRSYFNPGGDPKSSGIYKSVDAGETWKEVGANLLRFQMKGSDDAEFRSMAISYSNPEQIYVSYNNLYVSEDTVCLGVARSNDGGNSWDLVWKDYYAGGKSFISGNRISGWLDKRFGPGWGENPFHMAVDQNDPDICYTTDFGRTIKTTDGGKTWQQVYTKELRKGHWKSRGLQVTTGYMIAFDPFDSLHCFLADTDTGLMESHDGGQSWFSATHNNGVPNKWVNSTYWMVFDPDVKGRVWAAMSGNHDLPRPKMWRNKDMADYVGGMLRSDNGGKTWDPVSGDIGESAITHVVVDEQSNPNSRTLYACAFGKGVYKSIDGGNTWEQKNNGIEGDQPAAWRLTRKSKDELFLIVFRKSEDGSIGNNGDGALYQSIDGAETWRKMELPFNVNGPSSLLIDPGNEERLIMSAWGRPGETRLSEDQGGGIYLSENDGKTWIPVFTDDQHIHDITMDMSQGIFYACGFNSSAYRSENGNDWQRIRGFNFKWGKRVQPDPYDKEKVYIITFGGGVWHGPAIGDPSALEDIITSQASYTYRKN